MLETREETGLKPVIEFRRLPSVAASTGVSDFGATPWSRKPQVMSRNFRTAFGELDRLVAWELIQSLRQNVKRKGSLDGIQRFEVETEDGVREVWLTDNGKEIRALLAGER